MSELTKLHGLGNQTSCQGSRSKIALSIYPMLSFLETRLFLYDSVEQQYVQIYVQFLSCMYGRRHKYFD